MFHVIAANQDLGLVVLTHGPGGLGRRHHHVVEGARGVFEVAFRIPVLCVVGNLIFKADHVVLALRRRSRTGFRKEHSTLCSNVSLSPFRSCGVTNRWSWIRYLTPLFPPGEIRQSNTSSKSRNLSFVN